MVLTPFIAIKYLNLVVSMNYKLRLVMRSISKVFLVKCYKTGILYWDLSANILFTMCGLGEHCISILS